VMDDFNNNSFWVLISNKTTNKTHVIISIIVYL